MNEVRLILGDARDVLPGIGSDPPVALIVDPPYGIDHTPGRPSSWQRTNIEGDSDTSLRDWLVEWAASRGAPWAVFGSWKRPKPEGTRAVLVWDKGPAFGMGDLSVPWKPSWEEIYIGGEGWTGKRDEGVLRGDQVVSWESKGRVHPYQKPVSLMARLLAKLPTGVVVVDPCMGTGSTIVAAIKAGRPCIGIELKPEAYAIAERRAHEAEAPLFKGLDAAS